MHPDLSTFTAQLEAVRKADADTALLQRYMGTSLPVLVVRTDDLRALVKGYVAAHKGSYSRDEWLAWLDALYAGPLFEHRLAAGLTLHALPALRRTLELAHLRTWLGGLEGWGAVDTTCQNGWTASELLARWDEWQPFLDGLSVDANMNLHRASLVLLNAPLRESAEPRLSEQAFAAIGRLAPERDPLITKAVSWSLRTLLKHHASEVAAYLDAHAATLPPIAVRETRAKLESGRKSGHAAS